MKDKHRQDNVYDITKAEQSDSATVNADDLLQVPNRSANKYWLYKILLVIAIGVGLYTMITLATNITDEGIMSFAELMGNLDISYLLIAIVLTLVAIFINGLKYQIITQTIVGKARYSTSLKTALLGKYWDSVTPFAAGGQPMQIYYLHSKGYSGGSSSAIVAIKYFVNTFVWLVVGLILLFNTNALLNLGEATKAVFLWAGWIGWSLNALIPMVLIFFVIAPKSTERLVAKIIHIGCKLKIVHNKERAIDKAHKIFCDFRYSFKVMKANALRFVLLCLMCIIEPIVTYAFPYFIMLALSGGVVDKSLCMLLTVMTLNVYSAFGSSIVPTPGGSGVIETLVSVAFAGIVGGALFWVVFVWRFFVYYVYILIGLCITAFDLVRKASNRRRDS